MTTIFQSTLSSQHDEDRCYQDKDSCLSRCASCGMPRMMRRCPLCGSAIFSDASLQAITIFQLRDLARDLAATRRRTETEIADVNSSLRVPARHPVSHVTGTGSAGRQGAPHASSRRSSA